MKNHLKLEPPGLERPQRRNRGWLNRLWLSSFVSLGLAGLSNMVLAANYSLFLNEKQFIHTEKHLTLPQQAIALLEVFPQGEEEKSGRLKLEWYMPGGALHEVAEETAFSISPSYSASFKDTISFVNQNK